MFPAMWPHGSRTVLIVPRDATSRALDADFLRQANIRLLSRPDVDQALKTARRSRPALIVREIDPADRHVGFYRRLKSDPETAAIPLIIVAAADCPGLEDLVDSDTILRTPLDRQAYFDAVRRFVRLPQRRHRRHPINLRVTYRVADRCGQAFTRNLSMYGALLKTDRLVPDRTRISVTFHIPGESEETGCEAVVHRTTASPAGTPGLAIEFVGLCGAAANRLRAFIDHQCVGVASGR